MSQGVSNSTFDTVPDGVSENPLGRLTSILERGILSAQELQELNLSFEQGYDKNPNRSVFLNVITEIKGINKALYSPADGAFAIGLERKNDGALVESFCDGPEFQKLLSKELEVMKPGSDFLKGVVEDQVKNKYLSTHPEFLKIIAERMNRIAVLVLNIDPVGKDFLSDPSGCHDAVRESVSPEQISSILISKNLEKRLKLDSVPNDKKLHLLSSTQEEVKYYYEKDLGSRGSEIKKVELEIEVTKFEEALREIYQKEFFSTDKPMYLHVTRV